jgi:glycosyltransferase involved in cell wall biosynthesis
MTLSAAQPSNTATDFFCELSIVIPCLNEADTLGTCISKAQKALADHHIHGEIVIADNGSTDGSIRIATELGARVVPVSIRGYGSALIGGIAAARGKYILMADGDDSYDFLETHKFVEKIRQGYDLVQGCRLSAGGGIVLPGAMPFLHKWWGNPMFSLMVRVMFHAPVHDVYCGMRIFTKDLYDRLDLRCTGMEFATEMIIKSSLYHEKIAEIPITLHPDGRKAHPPHLKTFRDGWRTLRFYMMYSPRWLFIIPGVLAVLLGIAGYALALPGISIGHATFDAHTLLFSSLALLLGHQAFFYALFTKTFAIAEGLMPEDRWLTRFFRFATLERGLALGALSFLAGAALLLSAVFIWYRRDFGHLDYPVTLRVVIPGFTLVALGFQTIFSSFFVSILGMRRKQSFDITAAELAHEPNPPLS